MKKTLLIATLSLGLLITGCGSDSKKESSNTKETKVKKELTFTDRLKGKWFYGAEQIGHDLILSVNEKGEWTNSLNEKQFISGSSVVDTGSSLTLVSKDMVFELNYPPFKDNCFDLKLVSKNGHKLPTSLAFKTCKLDENVVSVGGIYFLKDDVELLKIIAKRNDLSDDTIIQNMHLITSYKKWKSEKLEKFLAIFKTYDETYPKVVKELKEVRKIGGYENIDKIEKLKAKEMELTDAKIKAIRSLNVSRKDGEFINTYILIESKFKGDNFKQSSDYRNLSELKHSVR